MVSRSAKWRLDALYYTIVICAFFIIALCIFQTESIAFNIVCVIVATCFLAHLLLSTKRYFITQLAPDRQSETPKQSAAYKALGAGGGDSAYQTWRTASSPLHHVLELYFHSVNYMTFLAW